MQKKEIFIKNEKAQFKNLQYTTDTSLTAKLEKEIEKTGKRKGTVIVNSKKGGKLTVGFVIGTIPDDPDFVQTGLGDFFRVSKYDNKEVLGEVEKYAKSLKLVFENQTDISALEVRVLGTADGHVNNDLKYKGERGNISENFSQINKISDFSEAPTTNQSVSIAKGDILKDLALGFIRGYFAGQTLIENISNERNLPISIEYFACDYPDIKKYEADKYRTIIIEVTFINYYKDEIDAINSNIEEMENNYKDNNNPLNW